MFSVSAYVRMTLLPEPVSLANTENFAPDLRPIYNQIEKRHDEAVARLQEWIHQPSIAAENRADVGQISQVCTHTFAHVLDVGLGTHLKRLICIITLSRHAVMYLGTFIGETSRAKPNASIGD